MKEGNRKQIIKLPFLYTLFLNFCVISFLLSFVNTSIFRSVSLSPKIKLETIANKLHENPTKFKYDWKSKI